MKLKTLPRYAIAGAIIAGGAVIGLGGSTPASARETCIDGGLTYQSGGQTITVPACGNTPQCERFDMETGTRLGLCGDKPAAPKGTARTGEKSGEQAAPAKPKKPATSGNGGGWRAKVAADDAKYARKGNRTATTRTTSRTSTSRKTTSGDEPEWLRRSNERRARVTGGRN
jgi:hypothetical protein